MIIMKLSPKGWFLIGHYNIPEKFCITQELNWFPSGNLSIGANSQGWHWWQFTHQDHSNPNLCGELDWFIYVDLW